MELTFDPRLLALASVGATWLVCALIWMHARDAVPPASGTPRAFHLSSNVRWMGALLILLGPGLLVFLLLAIPIGEKDHAITALLAMFLGGLSPVLGVWALRARYRVDDAGLTGYTAWGQAAYAPWRSIRSVSFHYATQTLRIEGGSRSLHVVVQLHEWPAFLAELERRLPHLAMPAELRPARGLRDDAERLAYEAHWQNLYEQSGRIFLIASLSVGAGALFLTPHAPAWGWSALGGAAFAAYPLLRRLAPKPRKYPASLGNLLQLLGSVPPAIWLWPAAYRSHAQILGGEAAVTGVQALLMTLQHIGVSAMVLSALLLLARWRWPRRFSRTCMDGNERCES